jgi:hypothetical protein
VSGEYPAAIMVLVKGCLQVLVAARADPLGPARVVAALDVRQAKEAAAEVGRHRHGDRPRLIAGPGVRHVHGISRAGIL